VKLSYTLAFPITSIIVILAIGFVFKRTCLIVNLHDDPNTPNTQKVLIAIQNLSSQQQIILASVNSNTFTDANTIC